MNYAVLSRGTECGPKATDRTFVGADMQVCLGASTEVTPATDRFRRGVDAVFHPPFR